MKLQKISFFVPSPLERKKFDIQIERIDLQDLISRRFYARLINFNVKWNLMWWCITGENWYFVSKTILTYCETNLFW